MKQLDDLRAHDLDHPDLLPLLAGVFLRLDRSERYDDMVAKVKAMGEAARPVCLEIVSQIAARDRTRDTIRATAVRLLQEWEEERSTEDSQDDEADDDQEPLLVSFHRVIGVDYFEPHDQAIYRYMRQARQTVDDVHRGLRHPDLQIPARNRAVLQLLYEGPHTIEGLS